MNDKQNNSDGLAPFDVTNNTTQTFSLSIPNKHSTYKISDCSCALACPADGPPLADEFSLLLSLFQDKESKENFVLKPVLSYRRKK